MIEPQAPNWERTVLEKVALQAIREQRRTRQWGMLFKLLWLAFAFLVLAAALGWIGRPGKDANATSGGMGVGGKHTAVVEVEGVIASEGKASADRVIKGLNRAFRDANTVGVVIKINSPGGSPVQAGRVNDEIRRLRAKYPNIPVHAVVEDLCASGGYYIAVAADRIYVDKASLVGSIGVIINGFGFTGTMDKLGIERRAYTSGENKDFLDPFAPENAAHKEYAKKMIGEIHQQFIRTVRQGRGARLKESPEMFTGLVWTGERSVELGLADGIGSTDSVARDVIKAEKLVNFTPDESVFEKFSKSFGASAGETLGRALASMAARSSAELR